MAGAGQGEARFLRLACEESVRNLHKDARAVAGARIGADRAAMFEIAEDADRVGHDLVRFLALDVGNEADAAGILFQRRVVQTRGIRTPVMFARFQGRVRHRRIHLDLIPLEL